jgi:uncharacterized protein YuzE
MRTLTTTVPGLVAEVGAALTAEGRDALVPQLATAAIERCTYDEEANAGYIYIVRPSQSPQYANLGAPVAETISFYGERGINIDVDHDGNIYGIEFLDRPDVIAKLKENNAL